ncbi:MAG: hypothetical protein ACRBBK_07905 [Paracoccaceae bacterium]
MAIFWIYAGLGAGMVARPGPAGGLNLVGVLRAGVRALPVLFFAIGGIVAQAPALVIAGIFLIGMSDLASLRQGRDARAYGPAALALGLLVLMLGLMGQSGQPIWGAFELRPLMAAGLITALFSAELWLMPYCGSQAWLLRMGAYLCAGFGLAALAQGPAAIPIAAGLMIFGLSGQALLGFRSAALARFAPALARLWPILFLCGQALLLWGTSIALH